MKYELECMGGERAKKILQSLLNELSGIEEEDMTTFELNLLRKCATKPEARRDHSNDRGYEKATGRKIMLPNK